MNKNRMFQKIGQLKGRKGSIALESLISFVFSLIILFVLLGTLLSVVASDLSDWDAVHTLEKSSRIYNALPHSPNLSLASVAAVANVAYQDAVYKNGLCDMAFPVLVTPDEYGSLRHEFHYNFKLKGAVSGDSIILPAAGFQVTDGVDFSERTVYITRTGIKYHEDGCMHLRKSKFGIDIEEAEKKGYTPCKNCH